MDLRIEFVRICGEGGLAGPKPLPGKFAEVASKKMLQVHDMNAQVIRIQTPRGKTVRPIRRFPGSALPSSFRDLQYR
jgi:hypothetical protein